MKSLSVVILFAASCGASGDGSSSIEELRAALPTQAWVAMTPVASQPAGLTSCRTPGASTFGVLTHKIATDVDGVLGGVLGVVQTITKNPPMATAPGHAVWGPIPSVTSSVYRLQVDESAREEFHFVFAGRDAKTDWRGVFQGVTVAPDATHRAGQIAVDFAVMHALDASVEPVAGQVDLHFEAADPARNVTATFAGIRGKSAPPPDDAQYKLVTAADQSSASPTPPASTSTETAPRMSSPTSIRSGLLPGRASPTSPSAAAASARASSTRSSAGIRRWPASTTPMTPPCTLLRATPPAVRRSDDYITIALRIAAKSTMRSAPTTAPDAGRAGR